MGLNSNKDLAVLTIVMHRTEVYLENEWSRDPKGFDQFSRLQGVTGQEIKVGCLVINGSTYEKASQMAVYNITPN